MPNDEIVADRGTDPAKPGLPEDGAAGNRGTGGTTYHFSLTATPELRAQYAADPLLFHRDVLRVIFGASVNITRFMREETFRAVKWSKAPIPVGGASFPYYLSGRLINKIGRVPVVAPDAIRDADGNEVYDLDGYGGQIALAVRTRDIPQDVVAILKDGIGFDPNDTRAWNGMPIDVRLSTLDDVTVIAQLMGELDDIAIIDLMRTNKPLHRSPSKYPPRVSLDRVRAFRQQLEALTIDVEARARQADLASFDEALGTASLHGCETLYFKVRELERLPDAFKGAEAKISNVNTYRKVQSPQQGALQAEIDAIVREKGFKAGTLGKLIKEFEKSFEKRAAVFVRQKLAHHLRLFDYHAARTKPAAMVGAIQKQGAKLVRGVFDAASLQSLDGIKAALSQNKTQHAKLIAQFPLMQYANFWTLLDASQKGLKGDFSIAHFNVMVDETRRSIREMLKNLKSASYVWKGDVMINGAMAAFGMLANPASSQGHNAMLTDIIQRKMRREQSKGVLKGILLGLVALALSLTGIGALVAIGVVISLVDVYVMIEDRAELRQQKLAAFGSRSPPSDFWLLLAIVGAAADVGGLVKVVTAGKLVAASKSGAALDNLLTEAGIQSERVRRSAHKLRAVKVDVENAKRILAKVAMSPQSIGGGMDAGGKMAYQLARLGLRKFEHFLLELPRTHLPARLPDTSDANALRNALTPAELKQLKAIHRRGLLSARKDVADLDELIAATEAVGQELNAETRRAAQLWAKRSAPGVKRGLADTHSPYNTLRAEHHAAMRASERLKIKLQALAARMKLLAPAAERSAQDWGFIVEDWVRLTPRKGGAIWPEMQHQAVKAVDSIRKGASGLPELMQSKAIITELPSTLEKAIGNKIGEAERIFWSSRYTDLVRDFNLNKFPRSANHHGFDLPKNWKDPKLKIYLEIPIVTNAPVDVGALRAAVIGKFEKAFPDNAVLRIRIVTREEVSDVLNRAALAVD